MLPRLWPPLDRRGRRARRRRRARSFMTHELEWMEREERYRQRVARLLVGLSVVVFAALGTTLYLHGRHESATKRAEARAADEARLAEMKHERDAFTADSAAAANRLAQFLRSYQARPLAGIPLLQVPLPRGMAPAPFVDKLWREYAHVVDPNVDDEQQRSWYSQYYVDIMN